jgi:hypothetical protein
MYRVVSLVYICIAIFGCVFAQTAGANSATALEKICKDLTSLNPGSVRFDANNMSVTVSTKQESKTFSPREISGVKVFFMEGSASFSGPGTSQSESTRSYRVKLEFGFSKDKFFIFEADEKNTEKYKELINQLRTSS